MQEMSSLNQFFSEIACQFQCYNIGRRIHLVDPQTFIDFENTDTPWKTPFLQHAWLALTFWKDKRWKDKSWKDKSWKDNSNDQHHVWFLKLPLDEQAKLNLAARDDFLRRLFAALEDYLTNSQDNNPADKLHSLENAMQDNPYGFQPKPEQLANFHAIVHKQLSLPASSYYADTQNYLAGNNDFQHWQALGFQGFADIAARLDETDQNTQTRTTNEQLINEAISQLPMEPYQVLGTCLENHRVSPQTTEAIYKRLISELERNDHTAALKQLCITSIRASSQASDQQLQVQLLSAILKSVVKTDIEVLAVISGRCWQLISHAQILSVFLEVLAVANIQHQGAFKAILSDLMFIPGMRDTILQAFRSPNRSELLAQTIGDFFKTI